MSRPSIGGGRAPAAPDESKAERPGDVRAPGSGTASAGAAGRGSARILDSFLPVEGVRACRKELEPRADLKFYTTALSVDDVDDVRAALGYDRINVQGGSYGTFAALNYMRRHPEHVRTAVLEGIVPPNARLPLSFARDAGRRSTR